MASRAGTIAWWLLIVTASLAVGLVLYISSGFLPSADKFALRDYLDSMATWQGRASRILPDTIWTVLLAPIPVAILYRCGAWLPKRIARNSALTAGVIVLFCSVAGSALFIIGEPACTLPLQLLFWILFHPLGHPSTIVSPGCPFG